MLSPNFNTTKNLNIFKGIVHPLMQYIGKKFVHIFSIFSELFLYVLIFNNKLYAPLHEINRHYKIALLQSHKAFHSVL